MEDKKENEAGALNATATTPTSTPKRPAAVSFDIERIKSDTFRSHACSPVREETGEGDDEEFTDDLNALEEKLSRSYQKARSAQQNQGTQRRVTLGSASGVSRRPSLGGKLGANRRPGSRQSLGGSGGTAGTSSYEAHAMNDLKDELRQREKLDHTRQHRLNALDIKRREAENKLTSLQAKFRDLKKEKDELVRQNNELKKKNKHLIAGKKRLEEQKQQQERTISALLAKVGNSLSARSNRTVRSASATSRPKSVTGGSPTGASPTGASPTENDAAEEEGHEDEDEDEFEDGEAVLSKVKPVSKDDMYSVRRYTMAPGEVSRIRTNSRVSVKESNTIRIDDLPKNSMSKDAANLCKDYGIVVHARVTKCVISGELKGYLTFADSSSAREAVRQLRALGHKARLVDDA